MKKLTVYACLTGQGITSDGTEFTFKPGASLTQLLQTIYPLGTCSYLYLCDIPAEFETWLSEPKMLTRYRSAKRGMYFDPENSANHVGRFERRSDGQELMVRTLYSWFGNEQYTPGQAREALKLLAMYLRGVFNFPDTPVSVRATPALTFQAIWETQQRIHKKQFPVLSQELRDLIRSSSGQGRIEMCTHPEIEKIHGMRCYDGILYYSAVCWGLGTELATHDEKDEYAGKVPGRYKIRYTVPDGWGHIGLFMTPKQQITGRESDSRAWAYPGAEQAGKTFETWVDGSELDILRWFYSDGNKDHDTVNMQSGMASWNIRILERIVFKPESESAAIKPLESVVGKLVAIREGIDVRLANETWKDEEKFILRMVRSGLRAILLHGIGSFNRSSRMTTHILTLDDPAPDGYSNMRIIGDDMVMYSVPEKVETYTQKFEHPEWCAQIWGRARARITKDALSLPRKSILAIRTDSVIVDAPQPQWAHNTKRGTLRPKWEIDRQLKAPHTFEELDTLIHRHVKGGE